MIMCHGNVSSTQRASSLLGVLTALLSEILLTLTRSRPSGAQNQAEALKAEGVTVTTGPLGELSVDLAEYGWFPAVPDGSDGEDEEE